MDTKNIEVIKDYNDNNLVLIKEIVFKGKRRINWKEVKKYLKRYVGNFYKIEETSEIIFVGNKLISEYTGSNYTMSLKGGNAKAKANAATVIPELIKTGTKRSFKMNKKIKHSKNALYGWYKYNIKFGIPVIQDNIISRYNIYTAIMLVNHAENGKKYLYDILDIKKRNEQLTK